MIIDCHVHVKAGDTPRREFSGDFIVARMDEAGIDRSVVFAICLPARESNEMVHREVQKFPDRLIGFAHALPAYEHPVTEEIRRAVEEHGFRGIKIHAGECSLEFVDIGPVIETAIALDVPCLFDCANHYPAMERIVCRYPEARIIVAHLGSPAANEGIMDQFIRLAKEKANLYLDTSYIRTPWKIGEAVREAGAHKILFGSDGPLIHPRIELTKIEVLKLAEKDRQNVLWKNAARLLKLSPST
ncbi:MAG: amidohydrolase family protein [Candidatus Latescibacteria bacterium]|nr:amidohydrolase family protein [Candidatus Latescibacterota bacterium]